MHQISRTDYILIMLFVPEVLCIAKGLAWCHKKTFENFKTTECFCCMFIWHIVCSIFLYTSIKKLQLQKLNAYASIKNGVLCTPLQKWCKMDSNRLWIPMGGILASVSVVDGLSWHRWSCENLWDVGCSEVVPCVDWRQYCHHCHPSNVGRIYVVFWATLWKATVTLQKSYQHYWCVSAWMWSKQYVSTFCGIRYLNGMWN